MASEAQLDPKYIIKTIVCDITLTKNDDATPASILCEYERGPEDIKGIFFDEDYDVLLKFGEPRTRSAREIQSVPVHYVMRYPVTVVTVDKRDPVLGTLVCTAPIMQAKARTALRNAVEGSAQSAHGATPSYVLTVMEEQGRNEWRGGFNIWSTVYFIEYTSGEE